MPGLKTFFDNDQYKLSMQQFVARYFPRTWARHKFINRGPHQFSREMATELRNAVNEAKFIIPKIEQLKVLATRANYLSPMYLDFLKGFRYEPSEVEISAKGGNLSIDIEGPWYRTILWEVPIMATLSEIYFDRAKKPAFGEPLREVAWTMLMDSVIEKREKIREHGLSVADFGTRRRYSYETQNTVISTGKSGFVGTSNVHLGLTHNIKLIGTMAHELIQAMAAIYGYRMANEMTMQLWSEMYEGDLGIMLTDTFTSDVFFEAFTMKYAKLFDGVRHDSGDPFAFAEKTIKHYRDLNIDPMSKTVVFSDGLDVDKAIEINEAFKGDIRCSFGIGTSLTNDVGVDPLNMVIKLVGIKQPGGQWIDTVKLSDDPGKAVGTEKEIALCKGTLNVE